MLGHSVLWVQLYNQVTSSHGTQMLTNRDVFALYLGLVYVEVGVAVEMISIVGMLTPQGVGTADSSAAYPAWGVVGRSALREHVIVWHI